MSEVVAHTVVLLSHDITVPAGKRWQLLTVKASQNDDVARAIRIHIYKEAAATNKIFELAYDAAVATAGVLCWPNKDYAPFPVILVAGNMIRIQYVAGGASSGSVDADGVVITYIEVDA